MEQVEGSVGSYNVPPAPPKGYRRIKCGCLIRERNNATVQMCPSCEERRKEAEKKRRANKK